MVAYETSESSETSTGGGTVLDNEALLPIKFDPKKYGDDKVAKSKELHSVLGYIVFYLFGVATLLPWNFITMADTYWTFKFRNTTLGDIIDVTLGTELQRDFLGYVGLASMLPNTIFLLINIFLNRFVSSVIRLIFCLFLITVLFLITAIFVLVDTDSWQMFFFVITIATVALMSASSGVLQGTVFGVAAAFPSCYLAAVISGQSLGAIVSCGCRILSIMLTASSHTHPSTQTVRTSVFSALIYFLLAALILVISFVLFLFLLRTAFYMHYTDYGVSSKGPLNTRTCVTAVDSEVIPEAHRSPGGSEAHNVIVVQTSSSCVTSVHSSTCDTSISSMFDILYKIRYYVTAETMVFVVTLAIYPGVSATVVPLSHPDSTFSRLYFIPVCCFFLFNVNDYLGRIVAGFSFWLRFIGHKSLMTMACLRTALIPLIMLCNLQHVHMSTQIASDFCYAIFICLLGFTNGHVSTLCVIVATKRMHTPQEQSMASTIMATFIGIGLCLGAFLSNITLRLI